jgi:hypothetical protein
MQNEILILVIVIIAGIFWRLTRPRPRRKSAPIAIRSQVQRTTRRVSARELIGRVRELRRCNAQWPQIEQALGDSELLRSIRGPHLFAPRVALNVIESGCEFAMQKNPQADAHAALAEAKSSMEKITKLGD